jgi:AcrR family transcriptional regulator
VPSPVRRSEPLNGSRLARNDRREGLLDAAATLIAEGSPDIVSMDSVAERTGVSRPLLYKHFANRDEMLVALYRREAARLHHEITRDVLAGGSIEGMFRALIRAALRASVDRGPLFTALRSAGAWNRDLRREQRGRDSRTVRAFTRQAVAEFGLEVRPARPAIGLLLGLTDQVLTQYRAHPGPASAALLEDTYMTIVSATLAALPRAAHGGASG